MLTKGEITQTLRKQLSTLYWPFYFILFLLMATENSTCQKLGQSLFFKILFWFLLRLVWGNLLFYVVEKRISEGGEETEIWRRKKITKKIKEMEMSQHLISKWIALHVCICPVSISFSGISGFQCQQTLWKLSPNSAVGR